MGDINDGRALKPSEVSIQHAKKALREPVYVRADDNMDRAVASALYRQQNSEIARCFLRLVAQSGQE